jgi:O-antigen/teichoic acid export membrane protein
VGGILTLRGLIGTLMLAGMAVIIARSDWSPLVCKAMLVASVSAVLMAMQYVLLGIIRAHERMEYDTFTSLIYQCVSLALTLAAVMVDGGLLGITLAQLAAETFKLTLLAGWVHRRFLRLRLLWDAPRMGYYLREALPIICFSLTSVISFRLNVLFLKAWGTAEDIALFDASQRLLSSITMIPLMVLMAVFPALCRMAGQDRTALRGAYAAVVKYLLIMGLAVTVVLAVWAEPVLRLLYGAEFVAGADSMRWLALSAVAGFLIPLTSFVMTSVGRQALSISGVAAGIAVNILVNLFAVPAHGHVGAAAGFTAGTVVAFAINGGIVRNMLGPAGLVAVAWRPLVSAALMAAIGLTLGRAGGVQSVVGLALAVAVFAASLLVLRTVTAAELAALRALRQGPGADGKSSGPIAT